MIVAFNATAYDPLPSGARHRAIGLVAALLRAGVSVRILVPRGTSLVDAVREEHAGAFPDERFEEIVAPLDPRSPVRRALASASWFRRNLPRDTDAFVTDFYPVLPEVPTVLTVHDLRWFAAPRFETARRVAWFRAFYPRMVRRAPAVVVPTASAAREVREWLGASRVSVVGNGLMRAWREAPLRARRASHLLFVGFHDRRKDLRTALEALRRAPRAPRLVVAGRGAPPRVADDLVASGRVRFVGAVDDAELVRLTRGAAALLHPSRYEGFGMSVIEAMALGVPVLASRCAAVEEVAGGFASLLPPGDADAWAAAIGSIAEPSQAAPAHARSYSWDDAASRLVAVASAVA